MAKIKLTEIQFSNIVNPNFDENFWFFELGRVVDLDNVDIDNEFLTDFYSKGINLWENYKRKIAELICDTDNKIPKEWVNDLITGDIRNFVTTLLTLLVSTYSIELSLAIPLVALVLKHDIKNFCKEI